MSITLLKMDQDVPMSRGTGAGHADGMGGAEAPASRSVPDRQDEIHEQRKTLERWLETPEARRYAERIIARRPGNRSAGELISETWLRLQRIFENRSEPYPGPWSPENASRFMARVMDNLSREMVRTAIRRNEAELVEALHPTGEPFQQVDARVMLQQLLYAVGQRVHRSEECPGCSQPVVAAAALEVIHLVLTGHDGSTNGTNYLDRLLYEALDRVGVDHSAGAAARRQRKARCGRCVTALLESGLRDIGAPA